MATGLRLQLPSSGTRLGPAMQLASARRYCLRPPEGFRRRQCWRRRPAALYIKLSDDHHHRLIRSPYCCIRSRGASCNAAADDDGDEAVPISTTSPLEVVLGMYGCLNDKTPRSWKELRGFLSDGCVFQDMAFPRPLVGKEEVSDHLKRLKEAMGKNIKFEIEEVHEAGQSVGLIWHLEWNTNPIPFSKGCSIYECSICTDDDDGQLQKIQKARVFVESPLKPGDVVLDLLKIISSLLDRFPPGFAHWVLQKPVAMMVKIYKLLMEPLVLPLAIYYTRLWTFAAGSSAFFLKLLLKLFML